MCRGVFGNNAIEIHASECGLRYGTKNISVFLNYILIQGVKITYNFFCCRKVADHADNGNVPIEARHSFQR